MRLWNRCTILRAEPVYQNNGRFPGIDRRPGEGVGWKSGTVAQEQASKLTSRVRRSLGRCYLSWTYQPLG